MKFFILLIFTFVFACSQREVEVDKNEFNPDSVNKFLNILSEEYLARSKEFKIDGYRQEAIIFKEKSELAKKRDASNYNEHTFILSQHRKDEVELARLFFEKLKSNVIIFDLFPESLARMQTYYDCMIVEFRNEPKSPRSKCTTQFDNMQKAFQRTGFSKNIKYVAKGGNRQTFVIYFSIGSSNVEQEFYPMIYEIAKKANALKKYKIRVIGLADKTGSKEVNEAISSERAHSVMRALIKAGVDRKKINVEYLADNFSLVNTKNAEKFNRRVVIDLIEQ